jgi:predicted site-specific integrase-resolvase
MAVLTIEGTEYKTTNELVTILGVSNVTIWTWIKQNKIQAPDRFHRNKRWRLWNNEEIEKLRQFANGLHSKGN